jgi:hypothetical protein
MMQSKVKALAMAQGLNNPQQFAIKAALPWATARNIWTGNLAFRLKICMKWGPMTSYNQSNEGNK